MAFHSLSTICHSSLSKRCGSKTCIQRPIRSHACSVGRNGDYESIGTSSVRWLRCEACVCLLKLFQLMMPWLLLLLHVPCETRKIRWRGWKFEEWVASSDVVFITCQRKDISYPTIIRSAIRPVPHGPDLPIPSPPDTLDNILDDLDQISHISSDSDDGYDPGTNDPELFSQSDLNDLVRDLGLPKDTAKVLGSTLKERHLLNSGASFSWYRFREKEFVPFFTQEGDLVFCNNVPAILKMFKIMYEPEEWRLFIDLSKKEFESCTSSQW
ncbi:uncharacterized protein TNCV_1843201 [Trichonephila clavipes]|nr:uncharacterized protein TNCV_1843201 [Trichonephila clavipes]